jgi:hypothetical protein
MTQGNATTLVLEVTRAIEDCARQQAEIAEQLLSLRSGSKRTVVAAKPKETKAAGAFGPADTFVKALDGGLFPALGNTVPGLGLDGADQARVANPLAAAATAGVRPEAASPEIQPPAPPVAGPDTPALRLVTPAWKAPVEPEDALPASSTAGIDSLIEEPPAAPAHLKIVSSPVPPAETLSNALIDDRHQLEGTITATPVQAEPAPVFTDSPAPMAAEHVADPGEQAAYSGRRNYDFFSDLDQKISDLQAEEANE